MHESTLPPVPAVDPLLCEREPIHTPGAIQPHGALLAVVADSMLVSHASANLAAILGRPFETVLGRPLEEAIGAPACRALQDVGSSGVKVSGQVHILTGPDGGSLYLHAHRSGRHLCVDLEPMHFEPRHRLPIILAQSVLKTFEHAVSVGGLCELAVQGLKGITGYDRVMAYRFGDGGHGDVIAEVRRSHLEAFLGLRFPASDIPQAARQRVGAIADASYVPVALHTAPALEDGTPLDLTHSALRSASPIHCEYMRNMKTAASLTVALTVRSQLWGMLVCHHATPRVAGPELRAAAGAIGQVVSLLLASLEEAEAQTQWHTRNEALRAVVERLRSPLPLHRALAESAADLLRLEHAGGALVRFAGIQILLGNTPPRAAADEAQATLGAQAGTEVMTVDDLGHRFPGLAGCAQEGSGAMLLPLATGSDDSILWFRPELPRTIAWGGDPSTHATIDAATARISPRVSFDAWKETVRGRSAPWTEVDRRLARDLRGAVEAAVAQRTKSALRDAEARLGLLAEHSGVVVALSDLDGTRHYVSPAAERVLGWRPEELVGHNVREIIHPNDRPALQKANATLLAEGQSSVTYRIRRPDGSWLWIDGEARLHQETDGRSPQSYVLVLRDATARKAAELKLVDALARMEQMASTDGMTGLANRRHFDEASNREWRRCARDRLPLSVLLLDADHFKSFNDRYGHLAGDDTLRTIASTLADVARRPGDLAARYGGEEFVLLMPGTDHVGALSVARRLCRRVQELKLPHEGNADFGVATISVGAATARPGDRKGAYATLAALLSAADAALYRAKRGGRNQAVGDDDAAAEGPQ